MICPRAEARINWRRTNITRHRAGLVFDGWFRSRPRILIVLQFKWECDVMDCNTRGVVRVDDEWRDARPEQCLTTPAVTNV